MVDHYIGQLEVANEGLQSNKPSESSQDDSHKV
jgi:hypothetical protein